MHGPHIELDIRECTGRRVFASLVGLRAYKEARSIAVYLAMPSGEVQTDAIVRHAFEEGKSVYVPYLFKPTNPAGPPRLMDMVSLHDLKDYESLERDRWGIPSVDPSSVLERRRVLGDDGHPATLDVVLDLIIMPGVAFDRDPQSGVIRRLGHGKGFYDYFVEQYAKALAGTDTSKEQGASGQKQSGFRYGLALTEQWLSSESGEAVPVGPSDQPLDGVILGSGEIIESRNESNTS